MGKFLSRRKLWNGKKGYTPLRQKPLKTKQKIRSVNFEEFDSKQQQTDKRTAKKTNERIDIEWIMISRFLLASWDYYFYFYFIVSFVSFHYETWPNYRRIETVRNGFFLWCCCCFCFWIKKKISKKKRRKNHIY